MTRGRFNFPSVSGLLDNRRLLVLGVVGPLVFLAGVVLVGWSERDFMAELGWVEWPSGTALGPHGWATVLVFLLTGLCQMGFALALFAQAGQSLVRKVGAGLLLVSGFGMAVLAFKTDHPDADSTWHGTLHVAAYFTFFLGLLLAYVFLAWGSWNRLDRSSWKYAPLAHGRLLQRHFSFCAEPAGQPSPGSGIRRRLDTWPSPGASS